MQMNTSKYIMLNSDILYHIATHILSPQSLTRFSQVSSVCNNISKTGGLWEKMCALHFGVSKAVFNVSDYKECYKKCFETAILDKQIGCGEIKLLNRIESLFFFSYDCEGTVIINEPTNCNILRKLNCFRHGVQVSQGLCAAAFDMKLVCNFIMLQELCISYTCVIPTDIFSLVNLTNLEIINNKIEIIPQEICKLTKLEWLTLKHTQIKEISNEIFNMPKLRTLNLEHNQIEVLPVRIRNMTKLKTLNLCHNFIRCIPKEIGCLTNLCYLDVGYNRIKVISKEIGKLNKLVKLDLAYNKIKTVPTELGNLSTLFYLLLNDNKLSVLPVELGQLNELTDLELSNNKLTTLPSWVYTGLQEMNYLDIENNCIDWENKINSETLKRFLNIPGVKKVIWT